MVQAETMVGTSVDVASRAVDGEYIGLQAPQNTAIWVLSTSVEEAEALASKADNTFMIPKAQFAGKLNLFVKAEWNEVDTGFRHLKASPPSYQPGVASVELVRE